MNNGTDKNVIDTFDRIASLPNTWDHNQHYHNLILKNMPREKGKGLDIGCGTGEFTNIMIGKCTEVTGIDVSEQMIEEAKKRNPGSGITYLATSAESFLQEHKNTYTTIILIATLHHTDVAEIFSKVKESMVVGGRFIVLDILRSSSIVDAWYSLLSVVLNPIMMLIHTGNIGQSKEEKDAWEAHAQYDSHPSFKEVKQIADSVFGTYRIKKLLFWRYILIFEKEIG